MLFSITSLKNLINPYQYIYHYFKMNLSIMLIESDFVPQRRRSILHKNVCTISKNNAIYNPLAKTPGIVLIFL